MRGTKIAKYGVLWLVVMFLYVQASCGNSRECINSVQLSDYNTSGLQCTKSCDCSNLKYEGYCISGVCVSNPRSPAQRKGDIRACKLLEKVGSCEEGTQEAQPAPLKELVWGDCLPPKPVIENARETCL